MFQSWLFMGFLQLCRMGALSLSLSLSLSHYNVRDSQCGAFLIAAHRLQDLQPMDSIVASGLQSAGLVVVVLSQLLCGMWDIPGPGIKPLSPALQGRFLTTGPQGKPLFKKKKKKKKQNSEGKIHYYIIFTSILNVRILKSKFEVSHLLGQVQNKNSNPSLSL